MERPEENGEEVVGAEAPVEDAAVTAPAEGDPAVEMDAGEVSAREAEGAATEELVSEQTPEPVAEAPPAPPPASRLKAPRARPAAPRPKASPGQAERRKARERRSRAGGRAAIIRLPKPEHERGSHKERRGVVVSSAMDKTIVVRVDTVKPHPRYKKVVRRSVTFHAHDEGNVASQGDIVRIVESRPLSKTKHWRLVEVVQQAR